MAGKTITRADLADAVYRKVGLSRAKSTELVEEVLQEIGSTLASGETVKLSSFGIFTVRDQGKSGNLDAKAMFPALLEG